MTRIICLLLLAPLSAFAQSNTGETAEQQGPWPLFANQDTLQVRIEAPLTTLRRERSDSEYLEGTFTYTDASGEQQLLDLKLRARGKYRRKRETCNFPPVRLNFRKKQLMGTEFAGQDKLKLVAHCKNGSNAYEQYVLKEYLAYRILNEMTDYSFGVRLLYITWIDTDRGNKAETRYGFVIEDDEHLAERIGAEVAKVPWVRPHRLDTEQANFIAVYQYLIANTDWSMLVGEKGGDCCHNVVLFSGAGDRYLPIPYDFDFSGLVNARYAAPNPKLPISTVTRRLYRGHCEHNGSMDDSVARFRDKETEIKRIISSIEGMEDKVRNRSLKYVDDFYRDIADAAFVESRLVRKCST